ncbi:MAG: molecular chaperone TorD family protein [Chloroflexota bacterium]
MAIAPPDTRALDRALARSDAYRVLAETFRDPDDACPVDRLEVRLLRSAMTALRVSLDEGSWASLRRIARRDERADEHRAIFGHVVAHGCPPYETEYGRRHVFGQSQELGDIRGFYEAFGVRPRRGGERPDHVACELEFMALLELKAAIAIVAGDQDQRDVCRGAAARFVGDHLGRWLPALAGRIAQRAPASGYGGAAAIGAALVADHAREVGALPVILGPDDLVEIADEPDGFRFECGPEETPVGTPPGG